MLDIMVLMVGRDDWMGLLPVTADVYALVYMFMLWRIAGSPAQFKCTTLHPVKVGKAIGLILQF